MSKFFFILIFFLFPYIVGAQNINWLPVDSAFELNALKPRKIYVDVYTDWCYWCKVMERKTFTNKEVIDYLNTHFYSVHFNAESKDSFTILGEKFTPNYENSKYNSLSISLLHGQMAFPSFNFTDEKNETIAVVPGYWKPKSFLKLLIFIAEDYFKNYNWSDFDKKFTLKELIEK